MSTAIVVTSGKGGTGKTSFTGGVACCLAALGNKVLCIDMDIGLRNLDITLGLADRALMDFTDVLSGRCSLEKAAVTHPLVPGVRLLTAPLSVDGSATTERVRAMIREAKREFDYVLIDSPAGLGQGFDLAVCGADRGIVVSTTDPSALRDAQRTVATVIGRVPSLHLVMNRVRVDVMRTLRTTIDDAMNVAGLPLIGVVPEDVHVALAAGLGRPLILASSRGAAVAYLNIAKRIMGQRVPLMKVKRYV